MYQPIRSAGQATTHTLADCQRAKYVFLNAPPLPSYVEWETARGGMSEPRLTVAGEAAFAQQHPECAALISQCVLPWASGGVGAYQSFPSIAPDLPPTYTWKTEADRQAWIAAHPNCGPYPPPVADILAQVRSVTPSVSREQTAVRPTASGRNVAATPTPAADGQTASSWIPWIAIGAALAVVIVLANHDAT